MKSKEPGAIRQLFMFVGSSKGKMKFSILMAVLGELFGMVPFLILAMLADSLYSGTATTKDTVILAGIAALCQCIKTFLTWRSSLLSHRISFTILQNIRERIAEIGRAHV